jgi:GSH-dependent disulfide-bond oxidoreductase
MIELRYCSTPNGHKITMFLEEAGLDYIIHPVDISAGHQFKPEFLAVSLTEEGKKILFGQTAAGPRAA